MQYLYRITQTGVKYSAYPLLLMVCIVVSTKAIAARADLGRVYATMLAFLIIFNVGLEFLLPLEPKWQMTGRSFLRDLKYMAVGGLTQSVAKSVFGWVALTLSLGNSGPLRHAPLVVVLPLAFLIFEFFQYWYHRLSHERGGMVGEFLWKTHSIHHLPDRVYVLMHPVGHPLNFLVINLLFVVVPSYLLGYSPEVVFLFTLFLNLQGIVSHLNVDIRAGWFNYLVVGTELHRFHHSSNPKEGKNYGVVLSVYDQLFGTFVYRPGNHPQRLGVDHPERYPDSNQLIQVLQFPFIRDVDSNAYGTAQND